MLLPPVGNSKRNIELIGEIGAEKEKSEAETKADSAWVRADNMRRMGIEQKRVEIESKLFEDNAELVALGLFNQEPSNFITLEQIQNAKAFCTSPKNADLIRQKIYDAQMLNIPFAVLLPSETGLSHRLEYYGPNRVYLKYDKAFTIGAFQVTSKVVEITSGNHFAERLAVENRGQGELYYMDKNKYHKAAQNLPENSVSMQTMEKGYKNVMGIKDVPEILHDDFQAKYTKYSQHRQITKIVTYATLQSGHIHPAAFPTDEMKKIATKAVLKAFARYHRKGIFHHDIRGSNILFRWIDGKLRIKIIDFDTTRQAGTLVGFNGTPIFFSPEVVGEQIKNPKGDIDPKHNKPKDAWALGMTIAQDIYGLQFSWCASKTFHSLLRNLNSDAKPRPDLSDIPVDVRPIVEGLLTFDLAQRMTIMQAYVAINEQGG